MKVWSASAVWNSMGLLTTILIGILAFWDGIDESDLPFGATGFFLAMIAPAACWTLALIRQRLRKVCVACRWGGLVVSLIGIAIYWRYAITGSSDPDTAGHMHVVLFPIVYVIFAILVMVPLLLIDVFRTKKSNRADMT